MAEKTKAEIEARLAEVKKEFDKYGRKPATVFENAPRALMQAHYEATESVLKWALGTK